MVAGRMVLTLARRIIHIAGNTLVIIYCVEMAVKRRHRPVSQGTCDKPYHEKTFEHIDILHNLSGNVSTGGEPPGCATHLPV